MSSTYLAPALAADLPPKAKLALIAIADSTDPDGNVQIDPEYLAQHLWRDATPDDVKNQVEHLVRAGYLARAPELDDLFGKGLVGYVAFEAVFEAGRVRK